ncbi:neprosin family prolyl endopeptidase [Krasilnikovia sp. MM14-A1004]|uniref:neprosin family prolyl endopeptidase n=1 Tax=Krasilnikovia sp. MM14-A1004 TaxID=3373541 RepID=UPI00399CBA6C
MRSGLLAAGLALATAAAIGAASTPDAAAAEPPAPAAPPAADPAAAGPALTPPARLPWGAVPQTRRGTGTTRPAYAPKGRAPSAAGATLAPPAAAAAAADPIHYMYGIGSQTVAVQKAYANFTVAKPTVAQADFHSLAELAMLSADGQQIVEVGWTVDRDVNSGDVNPHLFVFHWKDGAGTCYNGCGFVPYGGTATAGMALPVGSSKQFGVVHDGGAWWIAYDTTWVGYFPDSLWEGRFTVTGKVKFYGEVAAATAQPCTQMGNGLAADDANAARIGSASYPDSTEPVKLVVRTQGGVYSAVALSDRTFRYGGPGAC